MKPQRNQPTMLALDAEVTPRLRDLGLAWRGDGAWVEPGDRQVRRMVRFSPLKGNAAVLAWGLSLSFVPIYSGSRLALHRTMKGARLDLFDWPQSYRSAFSGNERFERVDCDPGLIQESLRSYVKVVEAEWKSWFCRVRSMESIEAELSAQIESTESAYRIHSPRPSYVLAFVKAARGDLQRGTDILNEMAGSGLSEDQVKKVRMSLLEVPRVDLAPP